jgi:hypothetical protein
MELEGVWSFQRNLEQEDPMTAGSHMYAAMSTILGLTTACVLVAVLLSKEAFRLRGAPKGEARMRALTFASLPLMAVFAALLVVQVLISLK